jgi:hypothetical protein
MADFSLGEREYSFFKLDGYIKGFCAGFVWRDNVLAMEGNSG